MVYYPKGEKDLDFFSPTVYYSNEQAANNEYITAGNFHMESSGDNIENDTVYPSIVLTPHSLGTVFNSSALTEEAEGLAKNHKSPSYYWGLQNDQEKS